MCGVCQQAPAAVTCKADAAALCVSCDTDIHSANPIARRHEWVPVEPFYDAAESIVVKSTTGPSSAAAALNYLVPNGDVVFNTKDIENNAASSWLIPNPNFNSKLHMDIAPDILKSSNDLIFPEIDSLLEFDYPTSVHTISGSGACNDSVVPVQLDPIPPPSFNMNYNISGPADHNCFDLDFCRSKLYSSFNNLLNLHSYKHSGLANKKTVTIQGVGKDQSVLLSTSKSNKQNKPAALLHKSMMKQEFRRMAKAVGNQVADNHYRPDLKKSSPCKVECCSQEPQDCQVWCQEEEQASC
ncbi:hypothetical protein ACFX2B_033417 [Malus domestica]